ncbi:MAG: helix-turn-helix transcriptional regulator [Planctomycetaceae bacterium]|nr:helix-turn-helix transcriptional regulator [Planctomycetaceae bacterium]MCA9045259.1 helix-turn-helix transcriptional regulator [Planctomycetaceae bacterium]MCB9951926.1 helix-turn-helix transcriptional regulator [Planctomycetaceae bacterium]
MDSKLLNGFLEMLILETLSRCASYGYSITQTVRERSRGEFELKEGSLYPALHRLERQKLVESYWETAEGRRRKYYRITVEGSGVLDARRKEWREFSNAVNGVLGLQMG